MGDKSQLVTRIGLLAGSLLIGLLLAELIVRVAPLPGTRYRSTALRDDRISKQAGPDYRDRDFHPRKQQGVFRILAIGDSITWGSGMHSDDAYPDRLGRAVGRLPSTRPIEW